MSISRAQMASQVKGHGKSRKFYNDYRREHGRFHPGDPRNPRNAQSDTSGDSKVSNRKALGMKHGGPTCRGMGAAVQGGNFKA